MNSRLLLAILIVSLAGLAQAEDHDARNNLVTLSVEVEKQLPNDVLGATFYVEDTDANPVKLADRINKIVNHALAKGKGINGVKLSSGNDQTWPVYSNTFSSTAPQHLDGWRTRAELQLEAHDFAAAQLLIADLQAGMNLQGIYFSAAAETRRKGENSLVGDALAAFRERAELVRQGLGGKSYKIVNIQLNNGQQGVRQRFDYAPRAMAMSSAAPVAQNLSAGDSTINMQVSGEIQIEP